MNQSLLEFIVHSVPEDYTLGAVVEQVAQAMAVQRELAKLEAARVQLLNVPCAKRLRDWHLQLGDIMAGIKKVQDVCHHIIGQWHRWQCDIRHHDLCGGSNVGQCIICRKRVTEKDHEFSSD